MPELSVSQKSYRSRLLLSELRREAELRGPVDVLPEIEALTRRLDSGKAETPELVAQIEALAKRLGRAEVVGDQSVRWLSFLRFTGPALSVLVVLGVLFERRRRRQREVSDEALSQLDEVSGSDSPSP